MSSSGARVKFSSSALRNTETNVLSDCIVCMAMPRKATCLPGAASSNTAEERPDVLRARRAPSGRRRDEHPTHARDGGRQPRRPHGRLTPGGHRRAGADLIFGAPQDAEARYVREKGRRVPRPWVMTGSTEGFTPGTLVASLPRGGDTEAPPHHRSRDLAPSAWASGPGRHRPGRLDRRSCSRHTLRGHRSPEEHLGWGVWGNLFGAGPGARERPSSRGCFEGRGDRVARERATNGDVRPRRDLGVGRARRRVVRVSDLTNADLISLDEET